ncbi:hypothetical protein ACFO3J_30420 [Streptomyces polygonati]|uniref:Helix-turn-helix domain-containing protein n=1 Tax=Streptomyces polygonati TaxID=1617087 RepID=A0ABV8HXU8_9ACTN
MRINTTARTRAFTVLGNDVLRDRRLSFTARGILAYLLSLPDGAREDVRTLADNNPGVGRRGVANAVDELIALGYYVRHTGRDGVSGQVRTETHVFDTPQPPGAPLPVRPGTGRVAVGKTGTFPKGKKNPGEEPTRPWPEARPQPPSGGPAVAAAAAAAETWQGRPEAQESREARAWTDALARGAALLARLTAAEPKLALSTADSLALAPLAVRWVEDGVPEPEARSLLTSGLPPVVHSARALLANRLVRKLPAPRTPHDQAAPAPALPECATCHDPLPRDQHTGSCAPCSGTAPATPPSPKRAPLAPEIVAQRAAAVRELLRTRLPRTGPATAQPEVG